MPIEFEPDSTIIGGTDHGTDGGGTGEGGSGSESEGGTIFTARDPTEAIGKRGGGRHKADCQCERCVSRRAAKASAGNASAETGTGARSKGKASRLDVKIFARQIYGVHQIAKELLRTPALEISEPESEQLAIAIGDIMALYSLTPNPKVMAWLQLAGVAGAIYVPRGAAIYASMKMRTAGANARRAQAGNINPVQPMNPPTKNGSAGNPGDMTLGESIVPDGGKIKF
jgi:hypothetical protein